MDRIGWIDQSMHLSPQPISCRPAADPKFLSAIEMSAFVFPARAISSWPAVHRASTDVRRARLKAGPAAAHSPVVPQRRHADCFLALVASGCVHAYVHIPGRSRSHNKESAWCTVRSYCGALCRQRPPARPLFCSAKWHCLHLCSICLLVV